MHPAYDGMTRTNSNALRALGMAIAGTFCCVIFAFLAIGAAGKAKREIDWSAGRETGDGLVTAARILAWLAICLWIGAVCWRIYAAFQFSSS